MRYVVLEKTFSHSHLKWLFMCIVISNVLVVATNYFDFNFCYWNE